MKRIVIKKKVFDKGDVITYSPNVYKITEIKGNKYKLDNDLLYKPYEIKKVSTIEYIKDSKQEEVQNNKIADLTGDWYARIDISVVRDLFVCQLKSSLKCTTCGNTSVTFDPFWDLSVPLPSSSRCKLDACLDLFIREEVLDGDEMPTCAKCKTRRKCTKTFTIQRFPKYLVIRMYKFCCVFFPNKFYDWIFPNRFEKIFGNTME